MTKKELQKYLDARYPNRVGVRTDERGRLQVAVFGHMVDTEGLEAPAIASFIEYLLAKLDDRAAPQVSDVDKDIGTGKLRPALEVGDVDVIFDVVARPAMVEAAQSVAVGLQAEDKSVRLNRNRAEPQEPGAKPRPDPGGKT